MVVGAPGVGKSNFCNFMIDGKADGRFKTGKMVVDGLTRTLQIDENYALNNHTNPKITCIDMPGFGDSSLTLE